MVHVERTKSKRQVDIIYNDKIISYNLLKIIKYIFSQWQKSYFDDLLYFLILFGVEVETLT